MSSLCILLLIKILLNEKLTQTDNLPDRRTAASLPRENTYGTIFRMLHNIFGEGTKKNLFGVLPLMCRRHQSRETIGAALRDATDMHFYTQLTFINLMYQLSREV